MFLSITFAACFQTLMFTTTMLYPSGKPWYGFHYNTGLPLVSLFYFGK